MLGFRAHRCRWEVWKRQEPEDSDTHFRKAVGSRGGREASRGLCCVERTSGIRGLIPFYEVVKIYPKILVLAIFFV